MSNSLMFYQDAGLTVAATLLSAVQASDGGAGAVDRVVYLGSNATGKKFESNSAPGVDQIMVAIGDNLSGLQIPTASLRLALSGGGLAGATPGAALAVGTQILSGVSNAVAVHVRIDAAAIAVGLYDNLSLATSATVEVAA